MPGPKSRSSSARRVRGWTGKSTARVEAAQAALDMGQRDAELGGGERGRERRVDIARDDHEVRGLLAQHGLQALHGARGLLAVASRADAQEVVWSRHAEVVEEHLGHQPVVVLAGMDHDVPGEGQPPAESPQNGRHLDDVRAGADHVGESHGEIPISAGPAVHAGLKVLQLGPLYKNHVRRWSSHAAALGCRVYAAGHVRPGRRPVDLSGLAEHVEVAPARLYPRGPDDHLPWLRALLDRLRPDVVHAHWLPRWGYFATLAGHPAVIATAWGCDIYNPEPGKRAGADHALRSAQAVLARSEHMAREVIARGVPAERVRRADLGVDLRRFEPAPPYKRARLRTELGLPDGPLILSFRDGHDVYNLDVVLEAFRIVRGRSPDASLALIHGHDPLSQRVRALVRQIDGVRVLGHVPHAGIQSYMRAATVGISIPRSDGSPSSVWEALACGLPVVLSDLPQLEEKVGRCRAVRLVGPRPEPVAAALVELLEHAERDRSAAREWAEANADERRHIARLGEIYAAISR